MAKLISASEFARRAKCDKSVVCRAISSGRLGSPSKVGRSWAIDEKLLRRFVKMPVGRPAQK